MAQPDLLAQVRSAALQRYGDARGTLTKLFPGPVPGEVYTVTLQPGVSRGHHLHLRSWERFAGLQGAPLLVLAQPGQPARRVLPLAGMRVFVPAGLAHAIFAPADQACLVAAAMERPHDAGDVHAFALEPPW